MTSSSAPAPRPDDGVDTGRNDGFIAFLKDNLEAIAVAVVMALVIKHFCVEAFKIPTESMNPTLLGERGNAQGEGDRILVDKFAYLLSSPNRWDVIVFRYPLDRSRNFIKRIAGLPGERMRISNDGDLWVRSPSGGDGREDDFRIPQKPKAVREGFYRAVYPPPDVAPAEEDDGLDSGLDHDPRLALERYFRIEGPQNAWRLERHGLFVFAGGEESVLLNRPAVREYSDAGSWALSGNSGDQIRDVRLAWTLRVEDMQPPPPAASVFSIAWDADDEYQARLELSSDKGASRALVAKSGSIVKEARLDVALTPGTTYELEIEYVDGMLRVHIGGDERAVLPDGRRFRETRTDSDHQELRIAASGFPMRMEDLRIDRDQRYQNSWSGNPQGERHGVDIPADSYFMLGDNTRNSSDSRRWRTTQVHLRGGQTIRYEHNTMSYVDDDYDRKEVVDVDGIRRSWHENDEDGEKGSPTTAAPFVHRDLIVGRAFLVFWPCFPDFPGRLGLIH